MGPTVRLGLRANAGQFALLVGINGLVGATVGQERSILPLLANDAFGLVGTGATLTFLVAFGLTKAFANLAAGVLADRFGRRPVLIVGWLAGVPVPLLIIVAPDWGWIVWANVFLGLNQGLTWSTTVIMKIDLVGPRRRGLALGLNEASGYVALAVAALATGLIAERAGLRPVPFLVGLAIVGLGLGASIFLVRETRGHAVHEGSLHAPGETLSWLDVIRRTSWGDRTLFGASQAGLVNNLNDGLAWGVLPLFFAQRGLSIGEIAVLAAAYPATWGVAQLVTGALSDRLGRRPLVVGGMALQAVALAGVAAGSGFDSWLATLIALGIGTAMVYPTLIAVVADVAAPSWRASAVGVYRLWRDLGFAAGALVAGTVADRLGLEAAIGVVAALTGASAMIAAAVIRETRVR